MTALHHRHPPIAALALPRTPRSAGSNRRTRGLGRDDLPLNALQQPLSLG